MCEASDVHRLVSRKKPKPVDSKEGSLTLWQSIKMCSGFLIARCPHAKRSLTAILISGDRIQLSLSGPMVNPATRLHRLGTSRFYSLLAGPVMLSPSRQNSLSALSECKWPFVSICIACGVSLKWEILLGERHPKDDEAPSVLSRLGPKLSSPHCGYENLRT